MTGDCCDDDCVPRTSGRRFADLVPNPVLVAYYHVKARLQKIRPLPAEPLGYIVMGHARFPIREPIVMSKGQLWFTGTTMNPFARQLSPEVTKYQILDPDGLVVHEGPVPPVTYDVITTVAMSLSYTVRLDIRQARWP